MLSQRLYPIPVRWGRIALGAVIGVALGAAGLMLSQQGLALALAIKAAAVALSIVLVVFIRLVPFRASLDALRSLLAKAGTQPTTRRG